ncbi:MAG: putative rane protein, partial [Polyangiaceae bacterium]|nr:putative rane protein [Polyangiaceae bacterium]
MMAWLRRHRWLLPVLVVLLIMVVSAVALARPGGGHSYSGGSRSSGSSRGGGGGGSGDGGVLFELLFLLVIEHPGIGIPLVLLVVVVMVVRAGIQRGMKAWSTTPSDVSQVETVHRQTRLAEPRQELSRLREVDPEFSLVL